MFTFIAPNLPLRGIMVAVVEGSALISSICITAHALKRNPRGRFFYFATTEMRPPRPGAERIGAMCKPADTIFVAFPVL